MVIVIFYLNICLFSLLEWKHHEDREFCLLHVSIICLLMHPWLEQSDWHIVGALEIFVKWKSKSRKSIIYIDWEKNKGQSQKTNLKSLKVVPLWTGFMVRERKTWASWSSLEALYYWYGFDLCLHPNFMSNVISSIRGGSWWEVIG